MKISEKFTYFMGRTNIPEDMIMRTDHFWEDPQKVMYLIDLLFMFDDQDRVCS